MGSHIPRSLEIIPAPAVLLQNKKEAPFLQIKPILDILLPDRRQLIRFQGPAARKKPGKRIIIMERQDSGLKRLINRYRRKFETPENINYYSYKDFKRAQRKYIKLMLKGAVQAQPGL